VVAPGAAPPAQTRWRDLAQIVFANRGVARILFASPVRDSDADASLSPQSSYLFDDLALGGKAPLVVLAEDAVVVDGHVETPAASANDLTVDSELGLELGRQTGGPWEVVSNAAVIDADVHGVVPF
jgi:hypothetical protein